MKQYPDPLAPALEARYRLALIARADGDRTRELALMKDVQRTDLTAGAARSDRTRYLGGMATLALAKPLVDDYRKVALVEPLKRQLKLKKDRMELALKAFATAADYGVAEVSTAATYQTAELYRDFGKALMTSQRPKGLKKDELEQYNVLLEEQAFPFEEKAIEVHEVNAKRTANGIYDASGAGQPHRAGAAAPGALRQGRTDREDGRCDPLNVRCGRRPDRAAAQSRCSPRARRSVARSRRRPPVPGRPTPSRRPSSPPNPRRHAGAGQSRHAARVRCRPPGLAAGRTAEAERGFASLTKSDPELAGPYANLGLIHRQGGKTAEAVAALEKAVQLSPQRAELHGQLGLAYRMHGDFAKARASYEKAIALDAAYAAAVLNLGILYDLYLWDGERALELYDRYMQLTPGGDEQVQRWIADLRNRSAKKSAAQRKEQG